MRLAALLLALVSVTAVQAGVVTRDVCYNRCVSDCQECVPAPNVPDGYRCHGSPFEGKSCMSRDGPGTCIAGYCRFNYPTSPLTCDDRNCQECTAYARWCDICKPGYWVDMATGKCHSCTNCPSGYISQCTMSFDAVCKPAQPTPPAPTCPSNCKTCTTSGVCDVCDQGYYRTSSGSCKACTTCSDGYDKQCSANSDAVCKPAQPSLPVCPSNCDKCTTSGVCDQCKSGYYRLSSGSCKACTKCPNGYDKQCGANSDAVCTELAPNPPAPTCPSNCDKCTTSGVCDQCKSGYYRLSSGSCKGMRVVCGHRFPQ